MGQPLRTTVGKSWWRRGKAVYLQNADDADAISGAAHAAAPDYPACKGAVYCYCSAGMLADESEGNGKTRGSYGLPRKHGRRLQLGLLLCTRFKLLAARFSFVCRFRVADESNF